MAPSKPSSFLPRPLRRLFRSLFRWRPWLLSATLLLVVVQIVALSPSSVEDASNSSSSIDPEALIEPDDSTFLSDQVPKGKVPDYTVEKFDYVSSTANVKQWKIEAERAFMYQSERKPDDKLVHARIVTAYLYDPDGKITVIRGHEAKYFMKQKDLEVFGDVHARFPDGFEVKSEYMRFHPDTRWIEIPTKFRVEGDGTEVAQTPAADPKAPPAPATNRTRRRIRFSSLGMDFRMNESLITLPRAAHVTVETLDSAGKTALSNGLPDTTTVDSDRCVIDRKRQLAQFTMDPARELSQRFVHITQPRMFARSRRSDLNYGAGDQLLNYMTAYDDVLIKEMGSEGGELRYGTGGRADFDTRRNVIILRQYPQVYEDNDTVTGDVITLHRDTDVVEVENSNAFSQGNQQSNPTGKPSSR